MSWLGHRLELESLLLTTLEREFQGTQGHTRNDYITEACNGNIVQTFSKADRNY